MAAEAAPCSVATMNEHVTTPATNDLEDLAAALRDPDPFRRVEALEHTTGLASVEAVERALGDDYPLVRREAVRALARTGGTHAARALLQVSAHDLSAEVREEAVAALAAMLRPSETAIEA
jgi:HEAT repeat protein